MKNKLFFIYLTLCAVISAVAYGFQCFLNKFRALYFFYAEMTSTYLLSLQGCKVSPILCAYEMSMQEITLGELAGEINQNLIRSREQ